MVVEETLAPNVVTTLAKGCWRWIRTSRQDARAASPFAQASQALECARPRDETSYTRHDEPWSSCPVLHVSTATRCLNTHCPHLAAPVRRQNLFHAITRIRKQLATRLRPAALPTMGEMCQALLPSLQEPGNTMHVSGNQPRKR